MNLDDRLQTSLDDRLRAAGSALREGRDPGRRDQAGPLDEPAGDQARCSPGDPARSLPPQLPAVALLVMALGAVLVVAVQRDRHQDTVPRPGPPPPPSRRPAPLLFPRSPSSASRRSSWPTR